MCYSILWNELFTIAVLGYHPDRNHKRNFKHLHANNRQFPTQPLTTVDYAEDGNVESMMDMPSAPISILSSFATYGPLLPRLTLAEQLLWRSLTDRTLPLDSLIGLHTSNILDETIIKTWHQAHSDVDIVGLNRVLEGRT